MLPKNFENIRIIDKYDDVDTSIVQFFEINDSDFYPPIAERIEITSFIELTFIHKGFLLVYEMNHEIVGILALCYENPVHQYYIHYLAVKKSHRRFGIGHQLTQAASECVKDDGGVQVSLTSWSTNIQAKLFYNKIGFVITKVIENDRSPGVHTYIFTLDLIAKRINNPFANVEIVLDSSAENPSRLICDFLDIDQEKSVLKSFDFSTILPIKVTQDTILFRVENEFTNNHWRWIDLTFGNVDSMVELSRQKLDSTRLMDFCICYLQRNTNKYLVLTGSLEESQLPIQSGNLVYLNTNDLMKWNVALSYLNQEKISQDFFTIIQQLTNKYNCSGIMLADYALFGLFDHLKINNEIKIFDPIREFALYLTSQRMKSSSVKSEKLSN